MRIKILLSLWLLLQVVSVQSQPFHWATAATGIGYEYGTKATKDAAGNTYILGYFIGDSSSSSGGNTFEFNGVSYPANGRGDAFFAKLDSNKQLVWMKTIGGNVDLREVFDDLKKAGRRVYAGGGQYGIGGNGEMYELPGGQGSSSGGQREFVPVLARAAMAGKGSPGARPRKPSFNPISRPGACRCRMCRLNWVGRCAGSSGRCARAQR